MVATFSGEMCLEGTMQAESPEWIPVSTDYDTSDKLYFEPLTLEDVLSIYKKEHQNPVGGKLSSGFQQRALLFRQLRHLFDEPFLYMRDFVYLFTHRTSSTSSP